MPLAAEDLAELERCNDQFAAGLSNQDVSAVTDLFADGAVLLPPQRDPLRGDGVERFLLFLAQNIRNPKFMTLELTPLTDDIVREVGSFSFRPRGPSAARVFGTYLFVWQKADGAWKLSVVSWNRRNAGGGRQRQAEGGADAA